VQTCERYIFVNDMSLSNIYLCGRYICLIFFFYLSKCIKALCSLYILIFNVCIYINALRFLKCIYKRLCYLFI
jgi:hypothetical protein